MLPCCCIRDFISFDMYHDHAMKKLNFDLLTSSPGSGGMFEGLLTRYLLQCCCIRDYLSLICNMTMF